MMANKKINAKIKYLQTLKALGAALIVPGIICFAASLFLFKSVPDLSVIFLVATAIGILTAAIGILLKTWADRQLKENAAARLTHAMLSEVMDRLDTYDPFGSLSHHDIGKSMGYPAYERIGRCGDYIKGIYRGIFFESCDFILESIEISRDTGGRRWKKFVSVFEGRILALNHKQHLTGALTVSQLTRFEDALETKQPDFDRAFSVRADDPEDMHRLLSPTYREALLKLAAEFGGNRLALHYGLDGRLIIVLRGKSFFEIAESETDIEKIKKRFAEQMELIGKMLEAVSV